MKKFPNNRAFRIGANVLAGIGLTVLYILTGLHLIHEMPANSSTQWWCAFLVCMFAFTWTWVVLLSIPPHPDLKQQKETARAVTIAVLSGFALFALGVTVMQEASPHAWATKALGFMLMASSLLPLRWGVRQGDLT